MAVGVNRGSGSGVAPRFGVGVRDGVRVADGIRRTGARRCLIKIKLVNSKMNQVS